MTDQTNIRATAWYNSYDFGHDSNGNPTAHYELWANGDVVKRTKRRQQIGYSEYRNSDYEQFTVLPSPDAPPGSGIVALVADGAFLSEHTTYTEAFEAAITLVNNPDTANEPELPLMPDQNPVHIRFVDDNKKPVRVLLCESELTREWSKFAADNHDWFGAAANEIAELCGYAAWRFGPDHGTIKLVGFEPGAGGFERPDPNEWYMWDAVNVASEDDINQYMKELNAIIETAKSLGWDY